MHLLKLLLFFIAILPLNLLAQQVSFASYYIPGLVIDHQSGLFIQLHNEIIKRTDIAQQLHILPTKRVQYSFKHNRLTSYFPELHENLPKKNLLISEPFWLKKIILYTLDKKDFKTTYDLEGLKLGAVHGYSYGTEIVNNKKIKLIYADNDDINVKLLASGRIDGILGDNSSTLAAINESSLKNKIHFNLQQPINILKVFYVCQNTALGEQTCDQISNTIKQLKSENIIKLNLKTGSSEINLP